MKKIANHIKDEDLFFSIDLHNQMLKSKTLWSYQRF